MAINPLSPTAIQQALFQANDKNKSGKLDSTEFAKALAATTGKSSITAPEAQQALTALDADNDGQINLTEFEQANVTAAQSAQTQSVNLYAALQTAGIASSNASSNLYTNLLSGSLGGSLNSTGALVGQIVSGNLLNKLV